MMTSLNSLTNVSSWSSLDAMSRLLFLKVLRLPSLSRFSFKHSNRSIR